MTATPKPAHPSDILMHLIVALMAPMFLASAGGDIDVARMAAFETLNQYPARNHMDLIAIAQIIAGGLAALGSLSLSLADDLPLSMMLRLRANAVALNRMAERHRRALKADPREPEPPFTTEPEHARYEEEVFASVAAAQKNVADALASLQDAEPAAARDPVPPEAARFAASSATATDNDRAWQARWASAMTDVAGEFTADFKHLTADERDIATRQAAMPSRAASQLQACDDPPRLRPGGLST